MLFYKNYVVFHVRFIYIKRNTYVYSISIMNRVYQEVGTHKKTGSSGDITNPRARFIIVRRAFPIACMQISNGKPNTRTLNFVQRLSSHEEAQSWHPDFLRC